MPGISVLEKYSDANQSTQLKPRNFWILLRLCPHHWRTIRAYNIFDYQFRQGNKDSLVSETKQLWLAWLSDQGVFQNIGFKRKSWRTLKVLENNNFKCQTKIGDEAKLKQMRNLSIGHNNPKELLLVWKGSLLSETFIIHSLNAANLEDKEKVWELEIAHEILLIEVFKFCNPNCTLHKNLNVRVFEGCKELKRRLCKLCHGIETRKIDLYQIGNPPFRFTCNFLYQARCVTFHPISFFLFAILYWLCDVQFEAFQALIFIMNLHAAHSRLKNENAGKKHICPGRIAHSYCQDQTIFTSIWIQSICKRLLLHFQK